MKWNVEDYSEVVKNLNYFIDIEESLEIKSNEYWMITYDNTSYMISDNGGETNIFEINSSNGTSIPHTSVHENEEATTPLELAFRMAQFLKGGWSNINWEANDEKIRKALNKYNTKEAILYEINN